MGAYSVGKKVAHLETDIIYETNKHEALGLSQDNIGLNYMVRYGVWRDQFEIVGDGTFLYSNRSTDGISKGKVGFQLLSHKKADPLASLDLAKNS